jgi:signal transduction histidine kinase
MAKKNIPHFDVHPSVVYQLGESLITDAVQALIELIKNCYDSDSTYAKVTIDTEGTAETPGTIYLPAGGRIIVEDDGNGMSLDDIETGWLLISSRKKLDLKQAKETTPGGRTPLGDKGLGRLGVQRLGENLEIFTKSENETGYHLGFSWLDFATAPTLRDVDIHLEETDSRKNKGTKVIVSNLHEVNIWKGQAAINKLQQELSRMISPFKQIQDFMVTVQVDGKSLDLVEISDKVRDIAPVRYHISFNGTKLKVDGKARLDFFRPQTPKDAEKFALLVESDNGKAFYDFIEKQRLAKTLKLARSKSKRWFVEFEWEKELENVDKVERDHSRNGDIANPGPFFGEVDSFDLGAASFQEQSVFDRISDYRRHIKQLSGIRVYRDGFAIRVGPDWLELGAQWTSATSYYGLKPDTTLGYIALSARDNMDLEETTDREGFKDTPYYRNFYALLNEFRDFTTKAHNLFGRSAAEFRKKKHEEIAHVDSRKTVEDISRTIKKRVADAATHQKKLKSFRNRLKASASESRAVVTKLKSVKEVTPQLRDKITEALSDLQPLIEESGIVIGQLSDYLEDISKLRDMGQVLEDRVDGLRRQMDDMYETVALGLTAEALSHEVFNVADQLAKRTKSVQTQLRNKGITDRTILTFIEYVHSSVMALRKQMSFLSPALRYVREQRHDVDVSIFLQDLNDFYRERLKKNKISINIKKPSEMALVVRMNKGKLVQIIDNFILNSEYWLKEDISQKKINKGTIVFEVNRPFVRIFDDGRGIDPSVEHAIFEPFISAKAKGQGRGLGLFIVKQLLDSEGCNVGVLPERNKFRRLYKFQIDFRGSIHE